MKVENMTNSRGNKVKNQFIIKDYKEVKINGHMKLITTKVFQSYESVICKITTTTDENHNFLRTYELDSYYWDYSQTTGTYRNLFLGENKAETQKKIDSGEYILTDLNN